MTCRTVIRKIGMTQPANCLNVGRGMVTRLNSGFPGGKKKVKVGKFQLLAELDDAVTEKKKYPPVNITQVNAALDTSSVLKDTCVDSEFFFDIEAGPSGYPNINYPTFTQDDFKLTGNSTETDNAKTVTSPNKNEIEIKSLKKQNTFSLIKKRFSRKREIFNFYSCELCGDYCSFSSKGFRSHRVTVHKIGVLKERTWDRFGHPFEPLETEIPPPSQIKLEDLDEQRQLEWALKESALMYAAKYDSDD
ncbi:uncharacterized protein TNCT_709981 [Trichonephila clavata]|uniref:Uncharacterized protein n=1 Tax=Trichonephila clavata TaxID=2740835 RepID=A0A8X6HPF3_TRICU|nr:uncharacterized protein TNCT_709981 [Trichonephila clavata]